MSAASASPLAMSVGQRDAWEVLARTWLAPRRQVQLAKMVLLAADEVANMRIVDEVGVTTQGPNPLAQQGIAVVPELPTGVTVAGKGVAVIGGGA